MSTLPVELNVEGPAAPPRSNGELVFAQPWQARIFGVTVALSEAGRFEWRVFQRELIAAVARAERQQEDGEEFPYYDCWLEALQSVLGDLSLVSSRDLAERIESLARRPVSHDHDHGRTERS